MSGSDLPTSGSPDAPKLIDLAVVAAVIVNENRILAAKRRPGGPSGSKWEFPGGKVEQGESPEQALQREIREELGLDIEVMASLGTYPCVLGQHIVHLRCFWAHVVDGRLALNAHLDVKWCSPSELLELDWALPDVPVVDAVLQKLGSQAP